jgi:hypothetical protein
VLINLQAIIKIRSLFFLIIFLCLGNLFLYSPSQAYPVLPSSFYGTIRVDGSNVEPGTSIKALFENQVFAEGVTLIYEGASVYTINVPGDDNDTQEIDGGREGEQIFFEVGGLVADQTGTWHSATNVELNLTVTSQDHDSETVVLDTPSPTQAIDQTEDSGSAESSQTVQETSELITPTESPPGYFTSTAIVPSPSPQSAQIILTPNLIDEAIALPTTINNPEPSLGDSQIDIQSATTEQTYSDQTSPAVEDSLSGNGFEIRTRPELFLVVGGIIVIGAAAFLIWIFRK